MSAFDAIVSLDNHGLAVPDMASGLSDSMDASSGTKALEKLSYLHQQLLENLSMTPHRVNADWKNERVLTRCSDAEPGSVLSLVDATAVSLYDVLQYSDKMDGNTIERVLELVQDWLDIAPTTHRFRRRVLYLLVKYSATASRFPPQLYVTGVDLGLDGMRDPIAHGGFADLFRGTYRNQLVAVKRLRINSAPAGAEIQARFSREALIWRQLEHPSILPFIGIDKENFEASQHMCLIAPWMNHGTLADYMKSSNYSPFQHMYPLLYDVVEGLRYLHDQSVIHGDINDVNILVDNEGRAQLCDFGLAIVGSTTTGNMSATDTGAGTLRFMSPERFANEESRRTMSDDIYAFACLCYTLVTGLHPFHAVNRFQVGLLVLTGQRPPHPETAQQQVHLSDCLWSLITVSWRNHISRPLASELAVAFRLLRDVHVAPASPLSLDDLLTMAREAGPDDTHAITSIRNLSLIVPHPDHASGSQGTVTPRIARSQTPTTSNRFLPPAPRAPPPKPPPRPESIATWLYRDTSEGPVSEHSSSPSTPVQSLLFTRPLTLKKKRAGVRASSLPANPDHTTRQLIETAMTALRSLHDLLHPPIPVHLSSAEGSALDEVARLAANLAALSTPADTLFDELQLSLMSPTDDGNK